MNKELLKLQIIDQVAELREIIQELDSEADNIVGKDAERINTKLEEVRDAIQTIVEQNEEDVFTDDSDALEGLVYQSDDEED